MLPSPSALILVAILPQPRDFEIARTLGWYRIPLRTAPKLVAVDFLAFYQPSSFGRSRWRIEYMAPVLGHEFVRRADLLHRELDHPRASEEYYKLQIGALARLPQPIPAARWKRLTFLYTTGARLLAADFVEDLVVSADERPLLWRALRERARRSGGYLPEGLPAAHLPIELLAEIFSMLERQQGR